MQKAWLGGNQLEGAIPSSLSQCSKLVAFGCENNLLTGSFPRAILSSCPFLTQIVLAGNSLALGEDDRALLAEANLTILKL
jgi:hypothetical protein